MIEVGKTRCRGLVTKQEGRSDSTRKSFRGRVLDIKVKEDVYMTQPPGLKDVHHPSVVCKLSKALYGLKRRGTGLV